MTRSFLVKMYFCNVDPPTPSILCLGVSMLVILS